MRSVKNTIVFHTRNKNITYYRNQPFSLQEVRRGQWELKRRVRNSNDDVISLVAQASHARLRIDHMPSGCWLLVHRQIRLRPL